MQNLSSLHFGTNFQDVCNYSWIIEQELMYLKRILQRDAQPYMHNLISLFSEEPHLKWWLTTHAFCACCKKLPIDNHSLQAQRSEFVCPAPVSDLMDFQLARNLSAIGRAQENVAQSLMHVEATIDCLNREIIVSAACSEATEQLLTSARSLLLQVQTLLSSQANEGADRLREAQIAFIMDRHENKSSTSASHAASSASMQMSGHQSSATHRELHCDGDSYAETVVRGGIWNEDDK